MATGKLAIDVELRVTRRRWWKLFRLRSSRAFRVEFVMGDSSYAVETPTAADAIALINALRPSDPFGCTEPRTLNPEP